MSVGAALRASREARGLSIDAVARTIRVQSRILAAIERDDVAAVPPRPFGRGFVRSYASEMGLDPERTAREYFAQFAPPPTPQPPPPVPRVEAPQRWPLLAVVSFGTAAGLAIALGLGRGPEAARAPVTSSEAPAGTSGSIPAPSAVEAPAPDAVPDVTPGDVVPAAAPAAPAPDLSIVLTATRPSWVTATADGQRALYQKVLPGAPQTITASRAIVMRVGDAGALRWQINGRDAGPLGRSGQVRDIRITPGNAATVR